jgi:hypothetical protein
MVLGDVIIWMLGTAWLAIMTLPRRHRVRAVVGRFVNAVLAGQGPHCGRRAGETCGWPQRRRCSAPRPVQLSAMVVSFMLASTGSGPVPALLVVGLSHNAGS